MIKPAYAEKPTPTLDTKSRTNVWTFVLYPADAASDWKERLEVELCGAISPIHDQDVSIEDPAEMLEPHHHILLDFGDGKKSFKQIKAIMDAVGGCGLEQVRHEPAMYAYLTHKNQPDKVQYDPADIIHFGGYTPPPGSRDSNRDLHIEVLKTIDEHNFQGLYALNQFYLKKKDTEALKFISRNSCYLNAHLHSKGRYTDPADNMSAYDRIERLSVQQSDMAFELSKRLEALESILTNDSIAIFKTDPATGELFFDDMDSLFGCDA